MTENNEKPIALAVTVTRTGVNMGDHAQDVTTAHEVDPDETIEDLARRLLKPDERWGSPEQNFIVVRLAQRSPKHAAPDDVESWVSS